MLVDGGNGKRQQIIFQLCIVFKQYAVFFGKHSQQSGSEFRHFFTERYLSVFLPILNHYGRYQPLELGFHLFAEFLEADLFANWRLVVWHYVCRVINGYTADTKVTPEIENLTQMCVDHSSMDVSLYTVAKVFAEY